MRKTINELHERKPRTKLSNTYLAHDSTAHLFGTLPAWIRYHRPENTRSKPSPTRRASEDTYPTRRLANRSWEREKERRLPSGHICGLSLQALRGHLLFHECHHLRTRCVPPSTETMAEKHGRGAEVSPTGLLWGLNVDGGCALRHKQESRQDLRNVGFGPWVSIGPVIGIPCAQRCMADGQLSSASMFKRRYEGC